MDQILIRVNLREMESKSFISLHPIRKITKAGEREKKNWCESKGKLRSGKELWAKVQDTMKCEFDI